MRNLVFGAVIAAFLFSSCQNEQHGAVQSPTAASTAQNAVQQGPTEYADRIRIVLGQLESLPPLFAAYPDQPRKISVNYSYNRKDGSLAPAAESETAGIEYSPAADGKSAAVAVVRTSMGDDGAIETVRRSFFVDYDNGGRIMLVADEDNAGHTYSFGYGFDGDETVSVTETYAGAETAYLFDFAANTIERRSGDTVSNGALVYIGPGQTQSDRVEHPDAQFRYHETIRKLDNQNRLVLIADVSYDAINDLVVSNLWSSIYGLEY